MMCSQYDTNGIGMYIPVCCVVVFTYDDDDKRNIMSIDDVFTFCFIFGDRIGPMGK